LFALLLSTVACSSEPVDQEVPDDVVEEVGPGLDEAAESVEEGFESFSDQDPAESYSDQPATEVESPSEQVTTEPDGQEPVESPSDQAATESDAQVPVESSSEQAPAQSHSQEPAESQDSSPAQDAPLP